MALPAIPPDENNPCEWTSIERDILRAVTLQVRLITVQQIARGWFPKQRDAERCARRATERLEKAFLLTRLIVEAHPILELSRPILKWNVGNPHPLDRRFHNAATAAQERWVHPHSAVEAFAPTKSAVSLFGAFHAAQGDKQCEATHDLHFTEVYLRYRRRDPKSARQWLGEAAFPKLGFMIPQMKDPDAFLVSPNGTASRILEFAGSYDAEHLAAFHEHCAGGGASRLADSGWGDDDNPFSQLYHPAGTGYELW